MSHLSPNWHTNCTSYTGLLATLSSDHGMILAIILFLTVPSLASTVLACLPACTKQALRSSPLTRSRSQNTTSPSRTQASLALNYRFFVATVFLLLSMMALAFLGVAIQVWHFCGEKQMGRQLYVFVWVLFALVPGGMVGLACGACLWGLGVSSALGTEAADNGLYEQDEDWEYDNAVYAADGRRCRGLLDRDELGCGVLAFCPSASASYEFR